MSQALRDQYPEEMTIVLQHQFWELAVSEYSIEVGLSFKGVPERLLIPFDSVTGFFDPSVQFGLKFELEGEEMGQSQANEDDTPPQRPRPRAVTSADEGAEAPVAKARPARKPPVKDKPVAVDKASGDKPSGSKGEGDSKKAGAGKSGSSAEVVSLDAFRKKT
jgi:hypothetical protein